MTNVKFNFQVRQLVLSICCLLTVFQTACDSKNVDPLDQLFPVSESEVSLSNGRLSVRLKDSGVLQSIRLIPDESQPNRKISIGNTLGLWVAGDQNGTKSNISAPIASAVDNFELKGPVADGGGLYIVSKNEFLAGYDSWPSEYGAPTHPNGSPKMFGDEMAWGAFWAASNSGITTNSFSDLKVAATAYVFNDDDLKGSLFVRYEISNESPVPMENLHIGFGGDVDLFWSDPANPPCGQLNPSWNQSGYNLVKNFSYTYSKPEPSDGDLPSGCYGALVGYSIVGSNSYGGFPTSMLAHRILTRTPEVPFQSFNETEIKSPNHVLLALQGLSSLGEPMISPATGETTAFAYTGNPVTGAGWVDSRKDVRSLQSISPISLAPGETVVTIVAIFTTVSSSFEEGFEGISAAYDNVMRQRSTWDY
jgi:hypothetical protein